MNSRIFFELFFGAFNLSVLFSPEDREIYRLAKHTEEPVKSTRSKTSITEARTQVRGLRKLIRKRVLTDQEEQVIRMRHGVGEPDSTKLQFRGQKHEETKIKLAMMEREFINELREVEPEREARKERIIDKLRNL